MIYVCAALESKLNTMRYGQFINRGTAAVVVDVNIFNPSLTCGAAAARARVSRAPTSGHCSLLAMARLWAEFLPRCARAL